VLALTSEPALRAWGLTASSLVADDFAPCQEVATLAAERGAEGVRWPSATGSGESVAIFWDRIQAASHLKLLHEFPVARRHFEAIADGAPLTHFLPELRGFSLYERDGDGDA